MERLCPANTEKAIQVIQAWHNLNAVRGSLDIYGDEGDLGQVRQLQALHGTGILLYADGKPCGVAAGYPLTDDAYDISLGKLSYEDAALGYYLRRAWMETLPDAVRLVNIEDDLDIEGLRVMKHNMRPVAMNDMWMAKRR